MFMADYISRKSVTKLHYRYAYDTDKEMMILKMVDLVTGNGRGMIE